MRYPILVFKENDKMIYFFSREDDFKSTNESLLSKKIFQNVTVVDSIGNIYKIVNAKKVGWKGFFWGYHLLKKGRQIKVEFEIENDIQKMSIEDLKTLLFQKLTMNKSFYGNFWVVDELLSSIKESNSYEKIIEIFQ